MKISTKNCWVLVVLFLMTTALLYLRHEHIDLSKPIDKEKFGSYGSFIAGVATIFTIGLLYNNYRELRKQNAILAKENFEASLFKLIEPLIHLRNNLKIQISDLGTSNLSKEQYKLKHSNYLFAAEVFKGYFHDFEYLFRKFSEKDNAGKLGLGRFSDVDFDYLNTIKKYGDKRNETDSLKLALEILESSYDSVLPIYFSQVIFIVNFIRQHSETRDEKYYYKQLLSQLSQSEIALIFYYSLDKESLRNFNKVVSQLVDQRHTLSSIQTAPNGA